MGHKRPLESSEEIIDRKKIRTSQLKKSEISQAQQAPKTQQFALNDWVKICADIERMKVLHKGHGDRVEAMRSVSSFFFFLLSFLLLV